MSYLQAEVARVLGITAKQVDVQQLLSTMGLDSLMAIELRNRVQSDLKVYVSLTKFIEGINICRDIVGNVSTGKRSIDD